MEQKLPLQQMVLRDWDSYMQRKEIYPQFMPYTKINSKWIKDLNINHNTIKVLDENFGRNISDIPHSNIITDTSPKARHINEKINKWDLIKTIMFCMAKKIALK